MKCKKCGGSTDGREKVCPTCGESTENTDADAAGITDFTADGDKPTRARIYVVCFFAIIALVIIYISLFGKYPILYTFSPKAYTAEVLGNTLTEINNELTEQKKFFPWSKYTGLKEYTLSAGANIEDCGAEFTLASSNKSKKSYSELGITDGGETVKYLSAFLDNDSLGVNISGDSDEYFTLPAEIDAEDWNACALREALGMDETESDLDFSYSALSDGIISKKAKTQLFNKTTKFIKKLDFSEKETTSIMLNEKTTKVKKLTFTADGDDFKDYINELFDVLESDGNIGGTLEEISTAFNDTVTFGEIAVIVYVSGKTAVEARVQIPVNYEDTGTAVAVTFAAAQTKNMITNHNLEISLEGAGKPINILLSTHGGKSEDGAEYSITRNLSITSPDSDGITASESFTYTKDGGAVAGGFFIDCGERFELNYSGTLTEDNRVTLDLSDFSLAYGQERKNASLKIDIVPKVTAEMPEEITEIPLLEMSGDELAAVFTEISGESAEDADEGGE